MLFKIILLFLALGISGCGVFKKDNEPHDTINPMAQLDAKATIYFSAMKAKADAHGFFLMGGSRGDSLLFTCLAYAAGHQVDFFQAEKDPGLWYRHPELDYPLESKSTISRDMLMGLLQCFWKLQKTDKDAALAGLERLIQYGESHDWVMGDAVDMQTKLGRTKISPTLMATIYEMRYQLGGADHFGRRIVQVWDPRAEDFPAHLTVLHTLIRGRMQGGINDLQLDFLKGVSERNPHNALYSAVYHLFKDGDQNQAIDILLEAKGPTGVQYFPDDRLPSTSEYCSDYLFQREQQGAETIEVQAALVDQVSANKDWLPCPDSPSEHPGIDFLFAYAVIKGMH